MYCSKICDSFPGVQLFNPDLSCNKPLHFCRLNTRLTNVPLEEIPTNTTSVNLKNNSIQILDNNSFTGLNDLTDLSLSNNHISDITPGTFQDQKNLTYLDLGYNNLTSINGTMWVGLDSVETIRLTGNDIKIIGTNGFSHLPELKFIIMSITVVKTHAKTILANTTYPNTKQPVYLAIEGDNYTRKCDESECWLKELEETGQIMYTLPYGTTPVRLKCLNSTKYWDEVDLNCPREFSIVYIFQYVPLMLSNSY